MYRQGMYTGSPILASADGYVHQQFYPGGIEIRHGNGWFTTYMHMSWHVAPGTTVKRGDRIGTMGSVGSNYPHLHYEQLYAPRRTWTSGRRTSGCRRTTCPAGAMTLPRTTMVSTS